MKYTINQLAQWVVDHKVTHQGQLRNTYYWIILMKDSEKAQKVEETVINYCDMVHSERRLIDTIHKLILRYLKAQGRYSTSTVGDIYDAVFPQLPLLPGEKDYKDDDTHWHWRSIISWELFHLEEAGKIRHLDRDAYTIA